MARGRFGRKGSSPRGVFTGGRRMLGATVSAAVSRWRVLESRESPRISTLLGRDAELRRIGAVLRRTRDARRGALIRVAGDLGSGKSALLEEALRAARSDGWTVLDTRCYAGEAAYSGRGAPPSRRASHRWRRGRRRPLRQRPAQRACLAGDQRRTLRVRVRRFAEGLLVDQPTLLAFDDAHWLDRQSIAALRALLDPVCGRCPAVLLTHPADYEAPALPAESRLIVSLQPLSREASEAVVRSIWPEAGVAVTAAIADRAFGLPFALAALTKRSATDGVSTPEDVATSGRPSCARRS